MQKQTRRAVLEKAITLSARYGFDRISYKEIAFEVGIPEEMLLDLFPTRESLLDAMLEHVSELLEHYSPTAEDIEEMLKTELPADILGRFVTAYELPKEPMLRSCYRFLFMEQARNQQIQDFFYEQIMCPPRDNAKFMIDQLVAHGAVPPCDSLTLAAMWNRTSLIFEMLTAHGLRDYEAYRSMTSFYIELIVRGVKQVPHTAIETQWKPRPNFTEILARSDSPKQRVMLAALDLFGEHGYINVSMSQIAQACGLSLSSTYRKYRSKSDIMQDIVALILNTNRIFAGDQIFSAALCSNDRRQIALTLADSYSNTEDELVCKLYRILFKEQFFNEDLKDFLVGTLYRDIGSMQESLDELVDQGRIPPCESRLIATSFVFCMCSFSIDAVLGARDFEQTRLRSIALLVNLILGGYQRDGAGDEMGGIAVDAINV